MTYSNGTKPTYGYDEAGAPTSLAYVNGGAGLVEYSSVRGVDGRVVSSASNLGEQDYSYDELGRLTKVEDTRGVFGGCQTRVYGFSVASERTSKRVYGPGVDGGCQTGSGESSWTGSFNSANQITNTGYTYDGLGRTRTTPAADTTPDAVGVLSATYFANDMVASLTQEVDDGTQSGVNVTKTNTYGLDPVGRVDTITSTTGGTESQRLKYRYGGASDSPSRIDTSVDGGVSWSTTRNITLPGVGFVGTDASTTTWQLSNLHGDVTATQPNTAGVVTLASNTETDEYGVAVTGTPGRYGYLGTMQRSSDALGGLTLMGVRLYNPGTGNFLSNDPVLGGTDTRYAYPQSPCNVIDPTGKAGCPKWQNGMIVKQFSHTGYTRWYHVLRSSKWWGRAVHCGWLSPVQGL